MQRTIILGSQSPRRRELIQQLDLKHRIAEPYECDEIYPEDLTPENIPNYLSELKSNAYPYPINDDEILLTADTLIIQNNQIIGKPKNRTEAQKILRTLSATQHTVLTGVTLRNAKQTKNFAVRSEVFFRPLTDQQINHYIDQYQPYDKAGAYGIQEWMGMVAIERIEGSFYNVMGLPTSQLIYELDRFD